MSLLGCAYQMGPLAMPLLTELVSIRGGFGYRHAAPNGAEPKAAPGLTTGMSLTCGQCVVLWREVCWANPADRVSSFGLFSEFGFRGSGLRGGSGVCGNPKMHLVKFGAGEFD